MMKKTTHQAGFTIIEMLIATLVFTVILLICLVGVAQIGKLYYKAVSATKTQELVRNLSADFTQQIQFGSELPNPVSITGGGTVTIFCVGDYRYRVRTNRQLGEPGVDTILKRMAYSGTCELDELVLSFDGATELASKGMRVQRMEISEPSPGLWTVGIRIGLGPDDLLDFPASFSDIPAVYEGVNCQSGLAGSEFCSMSELESTVLRRVR